MFLEGGRGGRGFGRGGFGSGDRDDEGGGRGGFRGGKILVISVFFTESSKTV